MKYLKNPLIAYLNINCVRNKIAYFRIIIKSLPLDYLVLRETKLDQSFPNAQLILNGNEQNPGIINCFNAYFFVLV